VAGDPVREGVLDALAHLCALAGAAFVARGAVLLDGMVPVPRVPDDGDLPLLSIVVPARNEARTIARCVGSLLAQDLSRLEVIVVDDRSDDRTGAILDELARGEPRLRVIHGEPLPDGWVGKPWALVQGTRASRGDWLLFTDADTWHAPNASASTLGFARRHGLDALSLWVHQELESWGERAVLPTLLGLILYATGSIRQLNDPRDTGHVLANGQYILTTRACYDALGGHAALRGEIVEDIAFARRLKADGRFRFAIADGSALAARTVGRFHQEHLCCGTRRSARARRGGCVPEPPVGRARRARCRRTRTAATGSGVRGAGHAGGHGRDRGVPAAPDSDPCALRGVRAGRLRGERGHPAYVDGVRAQRSRRHLAWAPVHRTRRR
jgi:hypothetical protein